MKSDDGVTNEQRKTHRSSKCNFMKDDHHVGCEISPISLPRIDIECENVKDDWVNREQ